MAFRIATESPHELTLIRRRWSAPLLFAAACTALLFGLTVLGVAKSFGLRALLPGGLTLSALALTLLFLRNHHSLPKALRFLPRTNSLEILESHGRTTTMTLHDLANVVTMRRPRGRYAMTLTFGDSATWELDYFAFRRTADQSTKRIRAIIMPDGPKRRTEASVVSPEETRRFHVGEDGTSFTWREQFSAGVLAAANLLFLGIAMTALGLAYFQGINLGRDAFLWGAYALVQVVGLLATVAALFLRHEILVTPQAVEFRTAMLSRAREERDRREERERPRAELSFPRSRLAALSVSLEPDRGVHRLRMLTPEDVEIVSALRGTDLGLIKRFRLSRKLDRAVRLPLFGLSFGEAQELRYLLAARARG